MGLLKDLHHDLSNGWKTLIGIIAVATVVAVIVSAGAFLPFTPYSAGFYTIQPTSVCPGDSIRTTVQREIQGGLYTVTNLDIYWQWEYKNGAVVDAGEALDVPAKVSPEQRITRDRLKTAPINAGEARLLAEVVVHGKMFGLTPVNPQEVSLESEYVTVLSQFSPECMPDAIKGGNN